MNSQSQKYSSLIESINQESGQAVRFMEVCGGHTWAIRKAGIPDLLPESIRLVSGPGCPVCVTSRGYINTAIALLDQPEVILATFGDLMRVPGSIQSLEETIFHSRRIEVVLSPLDALQYAIRNPGKEVVFLGIGFETTAPGVAATIMQARNEGIRNFSVLSSHKVMPPAMAALLDHRIPIDGFICPGHVSAITGQGIFEFIPREYHIPCVIAGFESEDILESILMLIRQINSDNALVENQYSRVVRANGNPKARAIMDEVFELSDDWWRGLGEIPGSGLSNRRKYSKWDAKEKFGVTISPEPEPPGCRCSDILKGLANPEDCALFGSDCTPDNPVGACMVSNEGTCQAWYRFNQSP